MTLKDIFNMAKANRYTQDGRDQIAEALENETEDVRYKPGDISQKTGLQKQPDGSWAEPKKGAPAGAKQIAKKSESAPKFGKGSGTESDPDKEGSIAWYANQAKKKPEGAGSASGSGVPIQGSNWMSLPSGTRVTNEGAREKMAKNNERIEALKKLMEGNSRADNFRLGSELKSLQNENEYIASRLPPETKVTPAEKPKAENKPALKLPDEKSSFATDVNRMKKLKKEDYKQYTVQLEKLHSKYPINKWKDLYNKTLNDEAPRQLTGDCKIKIKKS